jgi:hypothetical protein
VLWWNHCTKIFVLYKIQFFWVNQRPKMTTTTRFQRTLLKIFVSLNWTSWVQDSSRWVASISAYVENIFIGLENKCCGHIMLYYCRHFLSGSHYKCVLWWNPSLISDRHKNMLLNRTIPWIYIHAQLGFN